MRTTKEKADENIHDEIVENLQDLLVKNYDASEMFAKAMEKSQSYNLKNYLKKQAAQRSHFATEITDELRQLNEEPKEKGSFSGGLHRTWIDLKTALSSNKDEAILEECIRGEKASVEEYEDKLEKFNFPPRISNVLHKQSQEIHKTLNQVRHLEDLAELE